MNAPPAGRAATPPFIRWAVLLLGAFILAWRRPDQLANPQLWAEDGIFFFQAHEMGLRAFLTELAGYSQLAPRLIAAVAQLVDPRWVPHVFLGCTFAATLYVMSRALSPRCPLPRPAFAALALVLAPDAAEVLLNANNIQWVLACGAMLLLLSHDPARPSEWTHDLVFAFGMGLTGPFSVLLTPFFAMRAWRRRTRASFVLAAIVIACGAAQAVSILIHPQPPPPNPTFDGAAMAAFPGLRVVAGSLCGAWLPTHVPTVLAIMLTAALGGALLFLAIQPGETRRLRTTLVLLFAAMLLSTAYRCWHSMPVLCVPWSASRYVFPLQIILLWLLIATTTDGARWVRVSSAVIAIWIIGANLPRLRIAPVPDKHWGDYAARLRAGEEVTIPINPDGWTFTFPARKTR